MVCRRERLEFVLLVPVAILAVVDEFRVIQLVEDRSLGCRAGEVETKRRELTRLQAPDSSSACTKRDGNVASIGSFVRERGSSPWTILVLVAAQLPDVGGESDIDGIL